MEKVVIFYGHLEYITGIWYTLWSFGKLVAIWCISPFWYKNLATLLSGVKFGP
jgi:hypothetical protein